MSSYCYDLNCANNCCNYYGYCPNNYQGSNNARYTTCYYYYNQSHGFPFWAIGPIVFAAYLIFITICICCSRRSQQNQIQIVRYNYPNHDIHNRDQCYPQPYLYNRGQQNNPGYNQYNAVYNDGQPGQPYLQNNSNPYQNQQSQRYFLGGIQQYPQQQNRPIIN